jgi:hypothetical protein
MSEEPQRRLVPLGVFPAGVDSVFIGAGSPDPLSLMIADADARLARERDTEARALAAQIADAERLKATRSARITRRFKRALRMFARG